VAVEEVVDKVMEMMIETALKAVEVAIEEIIDKVMETVVGKVVKGTWISKQ
jgi:hypothetical protein